MFENFKGHGFTEEQAKGIVHAMEMVDSGNSKNGSSIKRDIEDIKVDIVDMHRKLTHIKIQMGSNFRIVYILGAAIFAVNCIPILTKLLGH